MVQIISDATVTTKLTFRNETYLVPEGALIAARGPSIDVDDTGITLFVDGTVFTGSEAIGYGILADFPVEILIGETGRLLSGRLDRFDFIPVELAASGSNLTNFGEIAGAIGVRADDTNRTTIVNHGTVSANDDGFAAAIDVANSTDATVLNTGTIVGGNAVFGGNVSTQLAVSNAGEIIGFASAVSLGTDGHLDNTGLIEAVHGDAVLANGATIRNTGTILAGSAPGAVAIRSGGEGADDVFNGGTIVGDVFLGGGDDALSGPGTIAGRVEGGTGDDIVSGSEAADDFSGEAGDDTLGGGGGDDTLSGGEGSDRIRGGEGEDALTGGAGDDRIAGHAGDDAIDGGAGADTVHGGDGEDTLAGGEGGDRLAGGRGDDGIDAGAGNDRVAGGAGEDMIDGGEGEDQLFGGADDDALVGGLGADRLLGNGGEDALEGGEGDDTLAGGAGEDTADGGAGADLLAGGSGDDALAGGAGNDTLVGGRGDDTLTGGEGADVFRLRPNEGFDVIADFENGIDAIDLSAFGLEAPSRPSRLFRDPFSFSLRDGGENAVEIHLDRLGGEGIVLVEGLDIRAVDLSDFIL